MDIKKIEEHLLNPPPGSKAAAAKEFGIDLTLLLGQLRLTSQQRIDRLQREMEVLEELDQARIARQKARRSL